MNRKRRTYPRFHHSLEASPLRRNCQNVQVLRHLRCRRDWPGWECEANVDCWERRVSGSWFRRVFLADGCHNADFPYAPEHMGSNVGTVRLVAQIFGEKFFAPVRSREARLDRHLRNGEIPLTVYLRRRWFLAQVVSYIPKKRSIPEKLGKHLGP